MEGNWCEGGVLASCSGGAFGVAFGGALLVVAAAIVSGVRAHRPPSATAWRGLAASLVAIATGRLAAVLLEALGAPAAVPGAASIAGVLAGCIIALCGASRLLSGGPSSREATLDASVVASAGGLGLWQVVLLPLLLASGADTLVPCLVTLAGVGVTAALLRVRFATARNTSGRLLTVGGVLGMLGGALATVPRPPVVLVVGVAALWALALALVGTAALHPSLAAYDPRIAGTARTGRGRFLAVVGAVAVVAPFAMVDVPESPLDFAAEMAVVVFVIGAGGLRLVRLLRADERADARVRRQLELQAAVADLGRRPLATDEPQVVVNAAVATVADLLGVDAATMVEAVPGETHLRYRATAGLPGRMLAVERVRRDGTAAGAALATRETVVVDDLLTDERFAGSSELRALGFTSAVIAPIMGREGSHGLLAVYQRDRRRFDPQEVGFVEVAANILASTLDRADGEARLRQQALHDPLTGLPNRRHLLERLDTACTRARGDGPTVIAIEVDGVDVVSDTLGNEAGDALVSAVAHRLATCFAAGDSLGRYADATFVGIWTGPPAARDDLVAIVSAALSPPFPVSEGEVFVRPTIGTAVGGPGVHAHELLRQADLALLWAKREGAWQAAFAPDMEVAAQHRLQRETDLRHALERHEFVCHYQPQVDMDSARVVGVEALVRWNHPREGLLAPAAFIEIAEQTGLVAALDRWVLEAACRQVAAWTAAGVAAPRMSVNVSAATLQHGDLPRRLAAVLADTGVDAGGIELEITESGVMQHPDEAIATLRTLRDIGVRIAVDDFGTGYSSLSYLQRFPVDTLKIDRSFVRTLDEDATRDSGILAAIVAVGRHLGLDLVAEGVETGAQGDVLQALGCDVAQGYYYARPLPAEELLARITTRQDA